MRRRRSASQHTPCTCGNEFNALCLRSSALTPKLISYQRRIYGLIISLKITKASSCLPLCLPLFAGVTFNDWKRQMSYEDPLAIPRLTQHYLSCLAIPRKGDGAQPALVSPPRLRRRRIHYSACPDLIRVIIYINCGHCVLCAKSRWEPQMYLRPPPPPLSQHWYLPFSE